MTKKIKIVHLIVGLRSTSGVSAFCLEVAKQEILSGYDVTIWCHHRTDEQTTIPVVYGKDGVTIDWKEVDFVHIHAVWSLFCVKAMWRCWRSGIKFAVSPHGCLMPRVFTKGRLKKFLVWHLMVKPLMKRAAFLHCTSEAEREACERLDLNGTFVVAPLGVDKIEMSKSVTGDDCEVRTVLFLGRLAEEKGLENLLIAWKEIQNELLRTGGSMLNWRLKIAGPDWLGYKARLNEKCRELDLKWCDAGAAESSSETVIFTGPADAEKKECLYREAEIFVLPSPMENFSMAVLEALAYGVPVIATKGTPWGELKSEKCGLWIDQGPAALAAALKEMMKLSHSERKAMGLRGRDLAQRRYSWRRVVDSLIKHMKFVGTDPR